MIPLDGTKRLGLTDEKAEIMKRVFNEIELDVVVYDSY